MREFHLLTVVSDSMPAYEEGGTNSGASLGSNPRD